MASRIKLQEILESVLGSSNVYFQPPEGFKMNYPCIVYKRSDGETDYANDLPYNHTIRYTITTIDKNPDSLTPSKLAQLSRCRYQTGFTKDNLYHDVYQIYY